MTTPPAPAPAAAPSDADMIEATFRALGSLVPGAAQGNPDRRQADTITQLARYGAADTDLATITAWLTARQK